MSIKSSFRLFIYSVEKSHPRIQRDLYLSTMNYTVEQFVKLASMMSCLITIIMLMMISLATYFLLNIKFQFFHLFLFVIFALSIFVLGLLVLLNLPKWNRSKQAKVIEGEAAVTGRRLLIQLESGKSLANSIIDVAKHKNESCQALESVAYELYMGKPLEKAIQEAIDESPSKTFKKIFVQIKNSLRTGSDVKKALKNALEDISRDKIIEFESFGRKLSSLGLFYMIFGTIAPSLGVVIMIIVLAVGGIIVNWVIFSAFLIFIFVIQAGFILIFTKMRPRLEI